MIYKKIILLWLILLANQIFVFAQQSGANTIHISGTFKNGESPDSVHLLIWKNIYDIDHRFQTPYELISSKVQNGKFRFVATCIYNHCYVSISQAKLDIPIEMIRVYSAFPGDDINITVRKRVTKVPDIQKTAEGKSFCVNCNAFTFSGRGSMKYQCKADIDNMFANVSENYLRSSQLNAPKNELIRTGAGSLEMRDSVYTACFNVLKHYKTKLSIYDYNLILANLRGAADEYFFYGIRNLLGFSKPNAQDKEDFLNYINGLKQFKSYSFPDNVICSAPELTHTLIDRAIVECKLKGEPNVYNYLKTNYKGYLRDRLITVYLQENTKATSFDSLCTDALEIIQSKSDWNMLNSLYEHLKIGKPFYKFQLPDKDGKIVKLTDFKGKVVFIDFWYTGCENCLAYYDKVLSKAEPEFKNNKNVIFISVCIDRDPNRWKQSIGSGQYTSADVCNLYTGGQGGTHPVIKQSNISSYPTPFILDKDGNIFNTSETELRYKGVAGLENVINQALAKN